MADHFTTNPGSGGTTFASDDVGGTHYPRLKFSVGPDGVAADNYLPWRLPNGVSAASINANVVKSAAGAIGSILAINLNAAVRYLKLYNQTATPVPGTHTPVATIPIPANTTGAGVSLAIPGGLGFSSGIAVAITANAADNDSTAISAGDVALLLAYV